MRYLLTPSIFFFLIGFCLTHTVLKGQGAGLPAKVLYIDQNVDDVILYPRKAGTTTIRLKKKGAEGIETISLSQIEEIRFNLSAVKPGTLDQLYYMGNYEDVIKSLAGGIIPYFGFVDQKANSNDLIQLFMKSLFKSGNYDSVIAAANEIEKYAASGDMRRFSDLYKGLCYLQTGDLESYATYEQLFKKAEFDDPNAAPIWYGKARKAILEDNWKEANTYLAKIITEFPMQTDWSGEALFLSASYHHSRTNLVVANQISQEIQIVVPLTQWPEKAAELEAKIKVQAEELGIELVDFGGIREKEREAGEAKIDYRERQRKLKQEEAERLRNELDNAEDNPL
jgi:tetratricopeptide (TPR) repeat protein